MTWLISTLMLGMSAAIATTFDDNIYLTAFFGKVNRHFRPTHVVCGEFLGFTVLMLVSFLGYLGGLMVPDAWIGLLGLLPVMIGISNLISRETEAEAFEAISVDFITNNQSSKSRKYFWTTLFDPKTYRVSAVTIANGGNNLGIYIPLFASSTLPSLGIIVLVCYLTVAFWCFLSYNVTRTPVVAKFLSRYASKVFPFVLIWLGLSILIDSGSYQLLPNLALLTR